MISDKIRKEYEDAWPMPEEIQQTKYSYKAIDPHDTDAQKVALQYTFGLHVWQSAVAFTKQRHGAGE